MSNQNKIPLSEIIGQPFHTHFKDKKTTHQIVYGGRASGKSSYHELKIAWLLLNDPNAEAVAVRKSYASHRTSTFAGLKVGFERLSWHLKAGRDYPRGSTGSIYINTLQGNHVHFVGINELEATKGQRPFKASNDIKILWLFEITEYNSEEELQQVISNYIRGNKDYFVILYEFNPPAKKNHWVYSWLEKMSKRAATDGDTFIKKVNYNDLPKGQQNKFLGPITLKEIETMQKIDYEQYKNIYLGEPSNLGGSIYKKFNLDKHTIDVTGKEYIKLSVGVDYGETDATVFTAIAYTHNREAMHVVKTYYHKNNVSEDEKTIDDYIDAFFNFASELWSDYGKYFDVYVDSAAKHFWSFLKKEKIRRQAGYFNVKTTDKTMKTRKYSDAIEERIGITNLMLGADYLYISKDCPELIDAIIDAERDKNDNRRDDGQTNVDSLDSFEYAWLAEIPKIENAILRAKGYGLDE